MTTAPENTEDFGTGADEFDIDSWLEQGTRPRREVTIYRDWALLEEYDRLAKKLEQEPETGDDESMGEISVREQMEDVLERMEASRLVFVVQALTGEEKKALAEEAPTKLVLDGEGKPILNAAGVPRLQVDSIALGDMTAAAAVIKVTDAATGKTRSTISAKQVRRLRVTLGDGPTYGLYKAAGELSQAGMVLPEVPSSRER